MTIRGLSTFGQSSGGQRLLSSLYHAPELPIHVFGRLFHHPLGLAAGFDKGAEALSAWPALGFSWLEYGGVTRFPQDGNPKPRMFRAESENALVNMRDPRKTTTKIDSKTFIISTECMTF